MAIRIASICAALALLAGCAAGPAQPGLKQRTDALLGLTELEVVRSLGVPDAENQAQGVRSLRWSWRELASYPDPWRWGPPGRRWPGGWPYRSERLVERQCDLEMEFERAAPDAPWIASSWRARGNACR